MKLAKIVLSVLAIAAFPALGCGGGDDDPGTDIDAHEGHDDADAMPEQGVDPAGTHHTYVASAVNVPETAQEQEMLGFDYDDDDQIDNKLGGALVVAGGFFQSQALIDEQIALGSFILLADVQATALDTATGVGFQVFIGDNPMPTPCPGGDETDPAACGLHLKGDGMFDIAASSPRNAQIVGQIVSGQLAAGPGDVTLSLDIFEGSAPLELDLVQAKVTGTVGADGITDGIIGGAITEEALDNDLIPVLQMFVNGIVERDCTAAGTDCDCTAGSTGEQVQPIFDTDNSCEVSVEEVKNNALLAPALTPDLDLFDAAGQPGSDGVVDSLSVGLGFTAVGADFDPAQ